MNRFLALIINLLLLVACAVPPSQPVANPVLTEAPTAPLPTPTEDNSPKAKVTFVGNSGFLITVGDKKILIDALTDINPRETTRLLEDAKPPFDNVDLVLTTHNHDDHFSPMQVIQYMYANPDALFISTTQAIKSMEQFSVGSKHAATERTIAMDPRSGQPISKEIKGIRVEAIYMSHGTPPDGNEIYNNAYIITLNGVTIFQTGDIANLADIIPYKLIEKKIDLAFIQNQILQDDQVKKLIEQEIAPKYLFPIHYEWSEPPFNADKIRVNYPDAVIFKNSLDSWTVGQ